MSFVSAEFWFDLANAGIIFEWGGGWGGGGSTENPGKQITQDYTCVQVYCSYGVRTHLSPMWDHLLFNCAMNFPWLGD